MSEAPLISIAKPGQPVGEAVRESLQQSAQARQLVEAKKQITGKIGGILNAVMQNLALDQDHAVSAAIDYAAGLAMANGASKEDFYKGIEKVWAAQIVLAEEVKEQKAKMLLTVAKSMMTAGQPIPPQFVAQLNGLGVELPEDVQTYIAAKNPAAAPADVPPPAPAAAEAKN